MATDDKPPRIGTTLATLWRALLRDMVDTYRPELHYMRGPGPKWQAKHRRQSEAPAMTGLADAAT